MNIITSRYNSTEDAGTVTLNEFDNAYDYQKLKNIDRLNKAWQRYFPVNNGKWDAAALAVFAEEYRQPAQFDVVGPKLDTLVGSLVSDLPDPTWTPTQGQKSIVTEAIAEEWYRDKEISNYEAVMTYVFQDGLIQSGDMQIVEDYRDHVPRISFKRILPGRLIWDPYWETKDDRDAEVAYLFSWMTPTEIKRMYPFAEEDISKELYEYRRNKSNYPTGESKDARFSTRYGDQLQVIEKHYVEDIKTTRLMGRPYGSDEIVPFPINKNREYLELFAEVNSIDWESVYEDTYSDKIHKVTTVIRELVKADIQIGKKSKIQTNGLPFYHFTTMSYLGQDMGLPESMASVEDTINKRESLVTELIGKANGGSMLVNEKLFGGDNQRRNQWSKNKNKPGYDEHVDLDAVKIPFVHLSQNQYPASIIDQISRMYETVLPIVSRVSDALSSISDSTTSGVLFERQFQTNMIANTLMNRAMRQFINNVAEGYFYQWQITYNYEHDVEFRDKRKITLNKEVDGKVYNSVKSIPRHRVVVVENKKSQTFKMRSRSIYAELLQSTDPNVDLPHYVMFLNSFVQTLDNLTDEERANHKVVGKMMEAYSRLDLVAKITGSQATAQANTLQSAQIDMQLQAMMSQMYAAQEYQEQISQEPQVSQKINYPQGTNNTMNQSPIEAASGGASIPQSAEALT